MKPLLEDCPGRPRPQRTCAATRLPPHMVIDIQVTSLLINDDRRSRVAACQGNVSLQDPYLWRINLSQFRDHSIADLLRLVMMAEYEMKIGELVRPTRLERLRSSRPRQRIEGAFPVASFDGCLGTLGITAGLFGASRSAVFHPSKSRSFWSKYRQEMPSIR